MRITAGEAIALVLEFAYDYDEVSFFLIGKRSFFHLLLLTFCTNVHFFKEYVEKSDLLITLYYIIFSKRFFVGF